MGLRWSTSRWCCFLKSFLVQRCHSTRRYECSDTSCQRQQRWEAHRCRQSCAYFGQLLIIAASGIHLLLNSVTVLCPLLSASVFDSLSTSRSCTHSYIILLTAVVAFLSVIDKTKIRTPHCTTICFSPHLAIIYIIYIITDDTPLYSPASSRLQTLLLCHIEISNVSSTYRQHPTIHTTHLFIQSGGLDPPTVSHSTRVGKKPCRG